jgi:GWxTD domain-containing protein
MLNYIKYLIVILFSVFVFSCKVSNKTAVPRNLERIYDPAGSSIHPEIKVYNNTDTSSIIVLRVFTKELLFNQANSKKNLQAEIKVTYNLYDLSNKRNLVDSAATNFIFEKSANKLYHTCDIPLRTEVNNKYLLEIITSDIKRKSTQYSYRRIERTNDYNEQDFHVFNKNNKTLKINSFVNETVLFGIKHYKYNIDSLNVFFYSNNFKIPQPPYIIDTVRTDFEIADTNWVCYLDSINYTNFQSEGVYYFTTSYTTNEKGIINTTGFALYNFGKGFPIVRTPDELIKPLAYLDSVEIETDKDTLGKYIKLAVDNFWLSKAKNIDKSRELLKIFYNRVMFANNYFTSYKEGWQTDRGMIYIIYGMPDYLFKSGHEEKWIYNSPGIGSGIVFTFDFIENPFSINHYILDREKLKYTGWDEAVKIWNEGEIFYFQN